MNKRIISLAVLAIGTAAVIGASAIPGPGITASPTPIGGITNSTEALLNSGTIARSGYSQATHECLVAAGFDYTPLPETTGVDLNGAMGISRLDLVTAQNSGYSSVQPKGPHEAALGTAEADLFANPGFLEALNGTEATGEPVKVGTMGTFLGGCKLEAAKTIYGNTENYGLATAAAMNILTPASHAASDDPGVADAVKAWKDCMAETPFSAFEGPWQAVDAGTAAGGQKEREIAVTDAICRDQTGLHATLDTILDKYVTTLVQQQDSQFQRIADILKAAAANSAKLTASKTS
ncbi:hypothetical protein [Arthrobacter glacialis]|uniref:Uncharacterized protein n=1 Tax=Arthrobacter glacialis TaxID=1664 RepID=A0A2S3ZVB4_ARTGL|nr:hypothetical protein [Arthrobacter glacialis]POH73186.1 hypothetical protein CVS27_11735 [Arthrobacter glacialis]